MLIRYLIVVVATLLAYVVDSWTESDNVTPPYYTTEPDDLANSTNRPKLKEEDYVSTTYVDSVMGNTVYLPCNISAETKEDLAYMVLWFKGYTGKPVYSYDVRGRDITNGLRWADEKVFENRSFFDVNPDGALLRIHIATNREADVYRCRVDFKNSPTRNFKIVLTVIMPPYKMVIYDSNNKDVAGIIGPLREGDSFTVTCDIRGGKPPLETRWYHDDNPVEYKYIKRETELIITQISMGPVNRSWADTIVRCEANNSRLPPFKRMARIDMHLEILSVKIMHRPDFMTENQISTVTCVSSGSRPSAILTFHRDHKLYQGRLEDDVTNNTQTLMKMQILPTPEDNNAMLICRAHNLALDQYMEDKFRMKVIHKPSVSITIGNSYNVHQIRESDDVFLICNIKANPPERWVRWYFEDTQIDNPAILTRKAYITGNSLVLRNVTRKNIGVYRCTAHNDLGTGESKRAFLQIRYSPICAQPSTLLVGAQMDVPVRVRCTVIADPFEVTFIWQFNNSGESFTVSEARYTTFYEGDSTTTPVTSTKVPHGGRASVSELQYRAASERDYGTLLCKAKNAVGVQAVPCAIQLVPASRPIRPNCTVQTKAPNVSTYTINCHVGYNGIIVQKISVIAMSDYDSPRIIIQKRAKNNELEMSIRVPQHLLYKVYPEEYLAIVAHNDKGDSEPFMLGEFGFRKPVEEEKPKKESSNFVFIALMMVLVMVALTFTVPPLIYWCRLRRVRAARNRRPGAKNMMVQVDANDRGYVVVCQDDNAFLNDDDQLRHVDYELRQVDHELRQVGHELRQVDHELRLEDYDCRSDVPSPAPGTPVREDDPPLAGPSGHQGLASYYDMEMTSRPFRTTYGSRRSQEMVKFFCRRDIPETEV